MNSFERIINLIYLITSTHLNFRWKSTSVEAKRLRWECQRIRRAWSESFCCLAFACLTWCRDNEIIILIIAALELRDYLRAWENNRKQWGSRRIYSTHVRRLPGWSSLHTMFSFLFILASVEMSKKRNEKYHLLCGHSYQAIGFH